MKILITTDWYLPVINGVVTSVVNLENALRAMGHDVRILTLSESRHSHVTENVTYIGAVGVGKIYPDARLQMARSARYLAALIRWKPDIVHSQCEFSTFHLAEKIAVACDCPLVHTYHTVYEDYTHYFSPSERVGKAVAQRLSKHILSRVDACIVPSLKTRTLLEGYGVTTPVAVIPTGIALERFSTPLPASRVRALRQTLGLAQEDRVLLYLGRLAKEKEVDTLLSYLARERTPHLKLLIVGDGPFRCALEAETAALGLDDCVVFAGMVAPEQVPAYYQLADVFVSASKSETQGLTYIEAMASGLPLLCRADPCLEPLIHQGVNGYVFDDAAGFACCLHELLGSAERRRAVGRAAQMTALAQYSIEAFAGHVLAFYRAQMQPAGALTTVCLG